MRDHTQQNQNVSSYSFVDLEILIRRRQDEGYPVEIKLGGQQEFPQGYLSADILPWVSSGDLKVDGQRLFETLVADSVLQSAWAESRGRAPQRRIRLRIDTDAAELHKLPWELLQDGLVTLSAHPETPFSRYLPGVQPWGNPVPVKEYPVRVLVVISNPDDLEVKYNLPRIDVVQERKNLEAIFKTIASSHLRADFLDPPVTLGRLEEKLRTIGGYHVLHYLGHGVFNDRSKRSALYLQNEEGFTRAVSDDKLAYLLEHLLNKPHLVFLAACQTAVPLTSNAFLGMAPKLTFAGIPAVVAMQGNITIKSAHKFGSTFYRCLLKHGLIDLSVNEARSTLKIAGQPDAGVPILFMRMTHGQLWEISDVWKGIPRKIIGSRSLPPRGELPSPGELPADFDLPFKRNEWFTGRIEQLGRLAQALFYDQSAALVTQVAQSGMGGVGKTQLAIELAYRYGRYLRGVHWLDATDPNRIDEQIADCGKKMDWHAWPNKVSEQAAYTLREWKRSGPRLVILDNIENPEVISEWLTGSKLYSEQLHLLLITRWTDWPGDIGLTIHPLDIFAPNESSDFLRHHLSTNRATDAKLASLAERLGHLPLALELAGRYLKRHQTITITDYLNELEKQIALIHPSMRDWGKNLSNPTKHDLNLFATFTVSWNQVTREENRVASYLLFIMAGRCAPNKPIPCEFLQQAARKFGISERVCDEALGTLTSLSLLQGDAYRSITIHRLLAEYAQLLARMRGLLPNFGSVLAKALVKLTREANETNIPDHFRPLYPHVEPIANLAGEIGLEEAGTLWNNLGCYLRTMADYPGAQEAFRRAIQAGLTVEG